jgi:uncharacterized oxidoreductase
MKQISVQKLSEIAVKIFMNAGATETDAKWVTNHLIRSELSGHPSHGVIRIHHYLTHIKLGLLNPAAEPLLEKDYPSYGLVNGNRSFGQVAATFAVEKGIDKAKNNGLAMMACFNSAHIGRLGDYVEKAAQNNLLGLALCNGGGPNVAPFGSMERKLGTNPLACAVPLKNEQPIVIDFGSASTVEGKLNVARLTGSSIPKGQVINKEGFVSENPNAFYDNGAILPIGNHKGSALSIVLEIFGGIFTGGRCSAFEGYLDGNGVLFMIMQADLFRPINKFNEDVYLLRKLVTSSAKASGVENVLFPGEKEQIAYRKNRNKDIEIEDKTWEMIDGYYQESEI